MDILAVEQGIIVHQVNCQGVMGAGIALAIRKKWPIVYDRYRKFKFKLGQIQVIQVKPGLWVCNLVGQDRYGRDKCYTDYKAVREGFQKLNVWAFVRNLPIYIPKGMGCNLAGGDWKIVCKLISEELTHCDIYICSQF